MYPLYAADAPKQDKPVIWSYDADYTGQEEWGLLTPEFAKCEIGTNQSPIFIARTKSVKLPAPAFDYKLSPVKVSNIGYTVSIEFKDGQYYTEQDKKYTLRSIEFHTPSEHVIKNTFYPLEIQLFHEAADGKKLILVVFSRMDKPLPALDDILKIVPKPDNSADAVFDPSVLVPEYWGHYAYTGSLTTPPCTEGIEWRLLKKTVSVSKEQLTLLSKFTGRNARLTQPVYMRTIEEVN